MKNRPTDRESIAAEARANGGCMCPKCSVWNLKHRRVCVKCGKRLKPSPSMLKQEAERLARAEPDPRSVGKVIAVDGRKFVLTKGKQSNRSD